MNQLVLAEQIDQVAVITLNRPERHNSLIPRLLEQLSSALVHIRKTPSTRAIIIQANGRSFSTGADMKGFYENLENLESYADYLVGLLNQLIIELLEIDIPVITAVHGIVTGGSLGLVLASDVVLVTRAAAFTPYYCDVGFSPDGGWTAILPFIIGPKRAAAVLMQNKSINARQAVEWGLADDIIPSGMIRSEAFNTAVNLAHKKTGSIRSTKELLKDTAVVSNLERERQLFIRQIVTPEAREGIIEYMNR